MKKILLFLLLTTIAYPQWDWGFGKTGGGTGTGTSRFSAVDLDGSTEYLYRTYSAADSFLNLNGYERTLLPQSTMKINFTLANNGYDSLNTFSTGDGVNPSPDTSAGSLRRWYTSTYNNQGTSIVGGKLRISVNGNAQGIQFAGNYLPNTSIYIKFKARQVSLASGAGVWRILSSAFSTDEKPFVPTTEEKTYEFVFKAQGFPGIVTSGASTGVWEFDDIEVREVTNSVTNGDFSSSGGWNLTADTTKGRIWASSYLRCTADGSTDFASRLIGTTVNKRFVVTYQITQYDSGSISMIVGGFNSTTTRSGNGVYSDTVTVTNSSSNTSFYISGVGKFYGSIDNVHLYEIPSYRAGGNHRVGWSKIDALPNSSSDTTSLQIISTGAGNATATGGSNVYIVSGANTYHSMTSGNKYTLEAWVRGTGVRTRTYTSDFSSATPLTSRDGWTINAGGLVEGNKDGIYGEDNVLSFKSDSANSGHGMLRTGSTTLGKTYKYSLKVYVPSGNTTIKRVVMYFGTTSNTDTIVRFGQTGNWIYKTGIFVATSTASIFLTALPNTNVSTFTSTAGDSFYIKDFILDSLTAPQVSLHAQGQTKSTTVSIIPSTFTKLVFNFEANSTVADSIRLYVNQADTIYVDSVNLSQAYDYVLEGWIYRRSNGVITYFQRANGLSSISIQRGIGLYSIDNTLYFDHMSIGISNGFELVMSSSPTLNQWTYYHIMVNRTGTSRSYIDGVAKTGSGTSANPTGNANFTDSLIIGKSYTGFTQLANANLGEMRWTRFDNIDNSTWTTSTPLNTYNAYTRGNGFVDDITGGNKKIVTWWDFMDDTSDLLMLMDLSGNGYNLTGRAVTTSDRINWKR